MQLARARTERARPAPLYCARTRTRRQHPRAFALACHAAPRAGVDARLPRRRRRRRVLPIYTLVTPRAEGRRHNAYRRGLGAGRGARGHLAAPRNPAPAGACAEHGRCLTSAPARTHAPGTMITAPDDHNQDHKDKDKDEPRATKRRAKQANPPARARAHASGSPSFSPAPAARAPSREIAGGIWASLVHRWMWVGGAGCWTGSGDLDATRRAVGNHARAQG
ncbi:hypothetical protein CERSUDRAFT_98916 [Gelatoporia subvermispora B]|uniref:Uncharacterized protein n=1 Tax=Ceriporiopsis subvermispora (strain B) TaxID=914234 RepID=M2QL97_CERS8|nr:hypothetical protein CERSUDRAFT_98916 [Gelatoporia subvermispora B]